MIDVATFDVNVILLIKRLTKLENFAAKVGNKTFSLKKKRERQKERVETTMFTLYT